MNYPTPNQNPACKCKGNPMGAFFCFCGHMLECHIPYTCTEAVCSHLAKHDFSPEQIDLLEAKAREKIRHGRMPPYRLDEHDNIVVKIEGGNEHRH